MATRGSMRQRVAATRLVRIFSERTAKSSTRAFRAPENRLCMSVTNEVIDAWIARNRGMQCTPEEAARMCRGDRVWYKSPRTLAYHLVTIKHIGPLSPLPEGGSEPASITIAFDDGHERNTVIANLRPRRLQ